jgi:hypothetical protein
VEDRPGRTLFVITTDGEENASRKCGPRAIKALVEREKRKYGWEFIFLGANIDAVATAAGLGIDADRAADYRADSEGTRRNFEAVGEAVSELRTSRQVSGRWKDGIEDDFRRRI